TPAGFDEPNVAGGGYRRTVVATVVLPGIYVNGSLTPSLDRVGEDLQIRIPVSLQNAPAGGSVVVTASSSNSNALIISTAEGAVGAGVATRTFTNTNQQYLWLQGLQQGQTMDVTFTGADLSPTVLQVAVDPSGFVTTTNNFTTTTAASNTTVNLYAARLTTTGLPGSAVELQEIRAGLTASVPVTLTSTPADPVAGTITVSPVVLQTIVDGNPASQLGVTQFDPNNANSVCTLVVPCSASIGIGPAVDFETPVGGGSYSRFVVGTVNPP
ncbi:MAG: hypothetical protein L6Q83_10595, partial [Gammaproteobacteria bacterium]|nr:hypothetical protein [Gammaproteobacteria bacterium]